VAVTSYFQRPHEPAAFVGNRHISSLDLVGPDRKTLRDKYRVGEPQDCDAGTAEEMKRRGYVGIYSRSPSRAFS